MIGQSREIIKGNPCHGYRPILSEVEERAGQTLTAQKLSSPYLIQLSVRSPRPRNLRFLFPR